MESGSQSSASACTSTWSMPMEMEFLILQQVQFLELDEDDHPLFHWQLVNLLDAHQHDDSHAHHAFSSSDSSVSCSTLPPINNAPIRHPPHAPHADHHDDANPHRHFAHDYHDDDTHGPQFEEEDDDNNDAYDLNDELVPWDVSNKLGRQRMRKLGKRAFSKMNNSKRSSTLFLRPGCIRGKHGLGLKHFC